MKQIRNLGILLLAVAMTTTACGQKTKKDDVPTAVKESLAKIYPNVEKIKWDKEQPNYEANFDMDKKEYSVLMDANGKVLETEVEMPNTELPVSIMEYMKSNYPNEKIRETAMITKGDVTEYEVEIKASDLIFDSNGQLVKSDLKTKKKQEENEEEGDEEDEE